MSSHHGSSTEPDVERYPARYPDYPAFPPDDELSLADLLRALGRQWKIIAGVTVLCVALAVAYALLRADQYRYSVELKIGQVPHERADGGVRPVETPATVVAQLQNSIIPAAIRETVAPGGDLDGADFIPEVSASIPGGSRIVRVTGDAAEADATLLNQALGRAAAAVVTDHVDLLAGALDGAERQRSRLQSSLKAVDERLAALADRRDALQEMVGQSEAAALAAGTELSSVLSQRGNLLQERADISESLEQVEDRIEVLREAVATLREAEATPASLQAQRAVSASVRAITDLQPTRMITVPTRSLEPVGISGAILVGVSLILGLGGGVVLALLADALRPGPRGGS